MSASTPSRQQQQQHRQLEPRDTAPSSVASNPASIVTKEKDTERDTANDAYSWNLNGRRLRAPRLIRILFDIFPLRNYPAERLPIISPRPSAIHTLYIHALPGDAANGAPSFNPTCLKWQTYLKICGLEFETVSSNNHASPSGALPFLLPASKEDGGRKLPALVPSHKLARWTDDVVKKTRTTADLTAPDVQAFFTLLDTNIRDAWLYSLYIEPRNFSTITRPNYTHSAAIAPIPYFLGREMQNAALEKIQKSCSGGIINTKQLYAGADTAFTALSTILDRDQWFFGEREPGLFDAEVFAYTHLLLSMHIHEQEADLVISLLKHGNLIEHRNRIFQKCYGGKDRSGSL